MDATPLNLLLADDDQDDCILFKDALDDLPLQTTLITVCDGEQLMQLLTQKTVEFPDVLFLDLNMPRKTGYECLSEIKHSEKLKHIPVVIYSTSYEQHAADLLYKDGAHYYIRKPAEFSELKKIIHYALTLVINKNILQPSKENFLLTGRRNEIK